MTGTENIKLENNQFIVYKTIKGNEEVFGIFAELKKAIKHRDYFRRYKWDENLKMKTDFPDLDGETFDETPLEENTRKPVELKYIHELYDGSYTVRKTIKGKTYRFGRYSNIELAKQARDYFAGTGWNLEDKTLFSDMDNHKKSYFDTKELF